MGNQLWLWRVSGCIAQQWKQRSSTANGHSHNRSTHTNRAAYRNHDTANSNSAALCRSTDSVHASITYTNFCGHSGSKLASYVDANFHSNLYSESAAKPGQYTAAERIRRSSDRRGG
jgi:hypothetical protein